MPWPIRPMPIMPIRSCIGIISHGWSGGACHAAATRDSAAGSRTIPAAIEMPVAPAPSSRSGCARRVTASNCAASSIVATQRRDRPPTVRAASIAADRLRTAPSTPASVVSALRTVRRPSFSVSCSSFIVAIRVEPILSISSLFSRSTICATCGSSCSKVEAIVGMTNGAPAAGMGDAIATSSGWKSSET